jgi:hypothetical protein
VIERLYAAAAAVMKSPEFQAFLKKHGAEPLFIGRSEFAAYIREESEKWAKVVKSADSRTNERAVNITVPDDYADAVRTLEAFAKLQAHFHG